MDKETTTSVTIDRNNLAFIINHHDLCGLFQPPGNLFQWGEVKSFTPEVEPGSLEIINGQLDKFFASYTRTV